MKNEKKYPIPEPYWDDEFFSGIASNTECTGLVEKLPDTEEESLSYRDIYNIPLEPYKTKTDDNR